MKKKSEKQSHQNLIIQDLLSFLDNSPTAWHAVDQVKQQLLAQGFREIIEGDKWSLQKGKKYFTTKNGSSLCAFITPTDSLKDTHLAASHTDSPSLKIKPNGEFVKENMVMLGVEVYGSPLLTSWLNRDLGIAGKVAYLDHKDQLNESLISLEDFPVIIPQLAIHLDRKVNEEGLVLNKQEHLPAIATLNPSYKDNDSYLTSLIGRKIKMRHLIGFDLFLHPLEKARLVGFDREMIASYRLDSLGSIHAIVQALKAVKPLPHTLQMAIFWDNEEIGSETSHGAASPFFSHTLERICLSYKMDREDFLRLCSNSICLSVDLAHALNPNYPERHDPRHSPLLSGGVTVKTNAQQRYATNVSTAALVTLLAQKNKLPLQTFASRSDIPSGTTIGPIHATLTGMPTVDIGYPQLSMHSIREIVACQDHVDMYQLLTHFYSK